MAHAKLRVVRQRYAFRCGYCGVSEADVGGELTVDHFKPSAAGGDDSDDNLVYACVRCNQYKGTLAPQPAEVDEDARLLHPLLDEIGVHLREDETTGRLEPLTIRGRPHLEALRLNRPALIANRLGRHLKTALQARLEQTLAKNAALREGIARRDLYIAYLEERVREAADSEHQE